MLRKGGKTVTIPLAPRTARERTQNGLRFFAKDLPDAWVAASLLTSRFLRQLAALGIETEVAIQPSIWKTV
ncbi:MAG TPA: hypothetical protein VKU88_10040 [Acidimicrobiales bacterium]|nr:hypothetical protein [Acidimicrobiales bacterium]